MSVRDAVGRARAYVFEAIRTNPGFGHGHGPLNHGHTVKPFTA
jgi:hydroxymethylpyrimidine/phosphomethylpyrimidine kinase